MYYKNPNSDFVEKNNSSSESDTDNNRTIDQDSKNKKRNITIYRPSKHSATQVPIASSNSRKSILKASRTFDKSSFDDMFHKNTSTQEKMPAQMEASEISEIEKIESVMNRSDEQIREVNEYAESSPSYKAPTKIAGFSTLSKFSPQKEPESLDVSSQTSGYERKDTDEIKTGTEKGSPHSDLEVLRNRRSNDRGTFIETPGFKKITMNNDSSLHQSSVSINQHEDMPPPPISLLSEMRPRNSNTDLADIFAKKISESTISRKHIKRATFVSNDPKSSHIIPAYTHYVLDDNTNQQQVYMPHLSEREIIEAFATLDMNKDGYITSEEIAYYLEVLEENASEAEIEEMIRMVDYEGTGRVRYEEFFKLATGKNLNPIGQAYPPTLDLFDKKKNGVEMKKGNRVGQAEESPMMKNNKPGSFKQKQDTIAVHSYRKEQAKIDSKLSKLPRLGDLGDDETKYIKTDKDERDSFFKGFLRQAGLNSKTFMERYHKVEFSNDKRVEKTTYKDFLGFFCIDDQDVTKKVFSIVSKDRNHMDMRQMMIALSLYLDFSTDEKIGLAYNLYDPDGREGSILSNELMKIFKMFRLGDDHKKLENNIIKASGKKQALLPGDSIPKEEFINICKEFPDLFPSR